MQNTLINKIEARKDVFSFNPAVEHLFIFVDDQRLDKLFSRGAAEEGLMDLIPSWLDYYPESPYFQAVKAYVQRQSDLGDGPKNLPILICPDDLDFACTTVVVEVIPAGDRIIWRRVGLDLTGQPNYIGETVKWLPGLGPFIFEMREYVSCREALENFSPPLLLGAENKGVGDQPKLLSRLKSFFKPRP